MKKTSIFRESIFATLFILTSIYGLSKIEINSDVVNPLSKALGDFNLTDIVFAHMRENPKADTNITVVNIGPYTRDRDELAKLIEIIAAHNPKVVGIDGFFRRPRKDSTIDSALVRAFSKLRHLVLVSELHENRYGSDICDSMETSHPMFMKYAEPGFADMITKGRDFFKTARECPIKEKVRVPLKKKWIDSSYTKEIVDENGKRQTIKVDTSILKILKYRDTIYYSFPLKIASIFAPEKARAVVERNNDYEIINWQGNIDTRQEDVADNAKIVFTTLDYTDVEQNLFDPSVIKDKIVIIGYLGDFLGDNAWEDKFFTPLNFNYIGKANPDMYGVVVHANVVSMILKGEFFDEMPFWQNMIFSIILIFLNVWFFSYLHLKTDVWYDGLSLLITLAEILVLMIIVLFVFNSYNYKIDITLASVALFLTGNLIEIHFGIVKPTMLKIGDKIPYLNKKVAIFNKN